MLCSAECWHSASPCSVVASKSLYFLTNGQVGRSHAALASVYQRWRGRSAPL